MKIQFFTLLAVAVAAMAVPQGPTGSPPADVSSDGATETFPSVIPSTDTGSLSALPTDLTTTSGSLSDVPVTSPVASVSSGNSTSTATTSKPTSSSNSTSRASASTTTFSTTAGASSVRSASVPLAVVACILGASQMF